MVVWKWSPRANRGAGRIPAGGSRLGLRRNIQDEEIVWEAAEDQFRGFEIAG